MTETERGSTQPGHGLAASSAAANCIATTSSQLEADKQRECELVLPSIVCHSAGGGSAERGVAFRSLQSSFCWWNREGGWEQEISRQPGEDTEMGKKTASVCECKREK